MMCRLVGGDTVLVEELVWLDIALSDQAEPVQ
jgi:hypothetical protein